jgi:GH24 family phage-related lysozyme (muramidase)
MNKLSEKAKKLILDFEGMDSPPGWPGGSSGVTIGIGYDLGYVTVDQFESDWGGYLSISQIESLRIVVGLKGIKAKNKVANFSDIKIKRADAEKVFLERTIPLTQLKTEHAFPVIDDLPADAQGALVSLVYNRGASMVDNSSQDRRREMRAIRDAVAVKDLKEIATQLRLMKRLWVGKNLGGLLKRRDAEADLVESCIVV